MNFAGPEIIVIVLVIVFLFGAKRIPDLARGFGRGIREFKDASKEPTKSKEQIKESDKEDKN